MRARLDVEIVRRGLAQSRELARRLILAGRVRVDSRPAAKPDLPVGAANYIEVCETSGAYASRAAYKLLAALEHFTIDPAGRFALDVGASSGGFTDVLLRRGAASVIALDVGYGQLATSLRRDPRVIVLERTNIRYVAPPDLPFAPDLVTIDVSFISLRLVLPAVLRLVRCPAEVIALIKPQFEVGKGKVGKGGVVRELELRVAARDDVLSFARTIGLQVVGAIDSPLAGPKGNREFLALMRWTGKVGPGEKSKVCLSSQVKALPTPIPARR
jgi:23S rRNA (cytidine1920-2'-O)/16S rRNA (cytidine1409-2'-O)-methyltransferase